MTLDYSLVILYALYIFGHVVILAVRSIRKKRPKLRHYTPFYILDKKFAMTLSYETDHNIPTVCSATRPHSRDHMR